MLSFTFASNSSDRPALSDRRLDILLVLLAIVSYGYFYGGSLWNQNARFDAILAYVELGTFQIDAFLPDPEAGINTGDWSFYNGHYYSNKAPGTILLGILIYAPISKLEHLLGLNPFSPPVLALNLYLINLFVSVLPCAVALPFFRRFLVRQQCSPRRALALTLILGFCTLLFPYSTQFWGHPTAAAFVAVSTCLLFFPSPVAVAVAGFCAGMAVLCDYLAAVSVVTGALVLLMIKFGGECGLPGCSHQNRWWKVLTYAAGGVIPLLLFAGYHYTCFGSPFTLATTHVNPIFIEEGQLFGHFTAAKVSQLLVSPYRGILLHMPILVLAGAGWVRWSWRSRGRNPLLLLCTANMLIYLYLNASFNGWHGGSTVSARYLILSLPFWIVCLKELPQTSGWNLSVLAASVFSGFNMLIIAAVCPTSPYLHPNPLYGWAYPMFFAGELAVFKYSVAGVGDPAWHAFNLGHSFGLTGLNSLLPFFAVVACFAWLLARTGLMTNKGSDMASRDPEC